MPLLLTATAKHNFPTPSYISHFFLSLSLYVSVNILLKYLPFVCFSLLPRVIEKTLYQETHFRNCVRFVGNEAPILQCQSFQKRLGEVILIERRDGK